MRIYKVYERNVIRYCKSFDDARAVIRDYDPKAKKIRGQELPHMMFENGWTIELIDIDPTKDGIISSLNTASRFAYESAPGPITPMAPWPIPKLEDQEAKEDAILLADDVDRLSAKVAEQERYIERLEKADLEVRKAQQNLPTVSPCIQYDNFPAEKTGKCLHCNKTVGYVGGMPRVNPPESIRD